MWNSENGFRYAVYSASVLALNRLAASRRCLFNESQRSTDRLVGWIGGTYARLSLASQQKANGIERAYPKCEWKVFGPIYYIRSIEFIADGRMGCGAVVDGGGGWWWWMVVDGGRDGYMGHQSRKRSLAIVLRQ